MQNTSTYQSNSTPTQTLTMLQFHYKYVSKENKRSRQWKNLLSLMLDQILGHTCINSFSDEISAKQDVNKNYTIKK